MGRRRWWQAWQRAWQLPWHPDIWQDVWQDVCQDICQDSAMRALPQVILPGESHPTGGRCQCGYDMVAEL